MARKLIAIAVVALGTIAASSVPALAANSITNIHFSPAYPATLPVYPFTTGTPASSARVNVTYDYTTTDTNGVSVYFGGNFAWYSGVNNRCAYPSGSCSSWFVATAPATVTSLTAYMIDWNDPTQNTNNALFTETVPVNYTFTTSSPPPPTACTPSATTLCVDDAPGDARYKVQASFATTQGGGSSGPGHAIPLASLGVTHGGLFWFFSADNPELLVKILNTCSFSSNHWFFASAGTNVGLTITVTDTKTSFQQVYTNPDLHPMEPIQDESTLPCP